MTRKLKAWIALLLLAAFGLAQANAALAACPAERAAMVQMAAEDGGCCDSPDLEPVVVTSGLPLALVRSPADVPVLFLPPRREGDRLDHRGLAPPPAVVPFRILLHSFLI